MISAILLPLFSVFLIILEKGNKTKMATNLETVPGQKGFLIISEDGAVVQSGGELQNDEETAAVMLSMVKNSVKLVKSISSERSGGTMQRLSVVYKRHTLVASVWNHKIYVVKRINPEQ